MIHNKKSYVAFKNFFDLNIKFLKSFKRDCFSYCFKRYSYPFQKLGFRSIDFLKNSSESEILFF